MSSSMQSQQSTCRRRQRRLPWVAATLTLLLGAGTPAYAFWAATTSSNNAAAAADALLAGSTPTAAATGTSVAVSWPAGSTGNGRPATGYLISRYSTATGGTTTAATGGCAGTVTTLTCTESNVPGGVWYYTVTPTIALWTGAESPRSTGASIDTTAPTATASVSPTPNAAGWNNTSPVTVTITADDGTSGSGVASISYTVDGGAQQTVNGAMASVPVTGQGTHTVSYFATDKAGNAGTAKSQAVKIDTVAPATKAMALANGTSGGAKAGTIDPGDTVNIAFTEAMDLTKFCPGWTGSAINGTATITNGTDATKDTISFTTTGCAGLTIGTINLGADYVAGTPAVFAGTSNGKSGTISNPSTLSWDSTSNSLVITLGALSSGSVPASSPQSFPVYTPAAGLADPAGNALPTTASPTPTTATRF